VLLRSTGLKRKNSTPVQKGEGPFTVRYLLYVIITMNVEALNREARANLPSGAGNCAIKKTA